MSRRRIAAYTVMFGVLLKHLFSNEYGPFDRVLEIGVFLLILYEIVSPHTLIRRAIRRKRLRKVESSLRGSMTDGEAIRNRVPAWNGSYDAEWIKSADSWSAEVERYLVANSEKATAEFRRIRLDQAQRQYVDQHGSIGLVSGGMGDAFQRLNARLENLHRIRQDVERYF